MTKINTDENVYRQKILSTIFFTGKVTSILNRYEFLILQITDLGTSMERELTSAVQEVIAFIFVSIVRLVGTLLLLESVCRMHDKQFYFCVEKRFVL